MILILTFATLPLYNAIGAWSFLGLFVVPSTLTLIYLYFAMPETRGREIADIIADLKGEQYSQSRRHVHISLQAMRILVAHSLAWPM